MSNEPTPLCDAYQVAYEEAVRMIDGQERSLDELRGRAGLVLTAGSAVTAFLGGFALSGTHSHGLEITAGGVFAVVAVLLLTVLWPTRGWKFRLDAKTIIDSYIEGAPPLKTPALHRELALRYATNAGCNRKRMDWRWWVFEAALILLAIETGAWLLASAFK
jgi:uncharacterized membrane protein YfcA